MTASPPVDRTWPWRVGRHFPIHVYEGDEPIATFHHPEDAARAVAAVNAAVAVAGQHHDRKDA